MTKIIKIELLWWIITLSITISVYYFEEERNRNYVAVVLPIYSAALNFLFLIAYYFIVKIRKHSKW